MRAGWLCVFGVLVGLAGFAAAQEAVVAAAPVAVASPAASSCASVCVAEGYVGGVCARGVFQCRRAVGVFEMSASRHCRRSGYTSCCCLTANGSIPETVVQKPRTYIPKVPLIHSRTYTPRAIRNPLGAINFSVRERTGAVPAYTPSPNLTAIYWRTRADEAFARYIGALNRAWPKRTPTAESAPPAAIEGDRYCEAVCKRAGGGDGECVRSAQTCVQSGGWVSRAGGARCPRVGDDTCCCTA